MKLNDKLKAKKLEKNKNMSLCSLILGLIIFIIGLLFLPICLVTYKRVTTFDYDSFEAILFYLCIIFGIVFATLGIIGYIKTKVETKKLNLKVNSQIKDEGETK